MPSHFATTNDRKHPKRDANRSGLLVTGATGMVGSYVIAEMLRRNTLSGSGVKLIALARGKGQLSAADRVDAILSKFENHWGQALPRPIVLQGDLLQPGLGLGKADSKLVRKSCDSVLHSAASLSFAPASQSPDNEPYRTNVDGTENLIKFCDKAGIESLHHISTAYVCGTRSGRVLENESNVGQEFANDYERSKTIAEAMVEDAFGSKSLTAYRPSIVIDRTGLAPVSGDRTIYGAYSMYQMLASRFGLPEDGVWFRNLGFAGDERKNLVDVDWIARAIATIIGDPRHHGVTHHLTTTDGTSIGTLDAAFRIATEQWLQGRRVSPRRVQGKAQSNPASVKQEIDQMAGPFVQTFLPYFRDDPTFDRTHIDRVIATTDLDPTPSIGQDQLLDMIQNWSAPVPTRTANKPPPLAGEVGRGSGREGDLHTGPQPRTSPLPGLRARPLPQAGEVKQEETDPVTTGDGDPDDVVICGYAVRLPGGVNDAEDFEELLFSGESAIKKMPADRLDRSLYFDSRRGVPGKTYTEMGGCVDPKPLSKRVEKEIKKLGDFDLTHRQFAQVATDAFRATFGVDQLSEIDGVDVGRAGVFVGHSGGTESGGPLAMATMAEAASSLIDQTEIGSALDRVAKRDLIDSMTDSIRSTRPSRSDDGGPELNAYSAASLAARLTGIQGRREVIDAACSSSLIALQHASLAIAQDRMDIALVGGATFNNVDNLALFSQSGACSDDDSHPFDSRASGLISSEGYVSVVLVRRRVATQLDLPVLAVVQGVGVASDGKGKGLWAPRSEGQQLAIKRASKHLGSPLQVDYLECHATSTQVGDATELESLTSILNENNGDGDSAAAVAKSRLLIGSVKSNLGHLLEAAGLVGMVKCLLAMERGKIPPSINFSEPTDLYDWSKSPVQVVAKETAWPESQSGVRVAGVNAFGIGGLNAHAVIAQDHKTTVPAKAKGPSNAKDPARSSSKFAPIAIVGRGVVLPGCDSVGSLESVLKRGSSQISDPPSGRWLVNPTEPQTMVGIGEGPFRVPHCRGGYVQGFNFDAQSYRIPPKLVRNANPAQLMLIESVRQSLHEFDGEFDSKNWTVDRQRVGVSVGTIFGGQFSNELQVGLRLPELEQHLRRNAKVAGVRSAEMDAFADQFRTAVLDRYPALLDETGGFTASTLASAIARIFNLMGGAYAVDAEEASGGLAILSGIERLNAGDVDLVICGATHRAMDLVAFDQLYRKKQLADAGQSVVSPKDGSRIFPGEGVASILLQRLDDAVSQGRNIVGVIDGISESWANDVAQSRSQAYQQSEAQDQYSAHQLVNQLGHFGGAQGLVQTIASTIVADTAGSKSSSTILETADDGYQIEYRISLPSSPPTQSDTLMSANTNNPSLVEQNEKVAVAAVGLERGTPVCLRIESSSREELGAALQSIRQHGVSASGTSIVNQFATDSSGLHQVGIVGGSTDEIERVAGDILDGPFADGQTTALKRGLGWIRFPSDRDKTAWLFPGQGSQYPEIPALLQKDPSAVSFLNSFDEQLRSMGLATVGDRLHDPERMLGRDVWWTQLWVLAVGTTMTNSLLRRGHRPDVVLGHSFGECTAAWCAGVMSTLQAIQFAKYRSDAVVTGSRQEGELLSVRASPTTVKATLQSESISYTVTHHNAPEQTVIAGTSDSIAAAKKALSAAGLASVVIPVPATFHTSGMEPARKLLAAKFENQAVRPAKFGYLSAISVRYLAEPRDVLANLIDQLTQPVCFAPAIDRLAADGCGLMVEVGPSDVLTRLASASTIGRAICLSTDDLNRDHDQQNLLVDLAIEAFQPGSASPPTGQAHSVPTNARSAVKGSRFNPTVGSASRASSATAFEVVDVTKRKRAGGMASPVVKTIPTARTVGPVSMSPAVSLVQPSISVEPAVSQAVAAVAVPAGMRESAKAFLFDLVVDLTGYDPDIIEFDADLEGELGVDSIKKAQLIGEIVQWGNLDVDLQSMRLAQFASLNDILELIGETAADDSIAEVDNGGNQAGISQASMNQPFADTSVVGDVDVADSLQRMIIDLVVDQTGYDEDIIDMDADLEGELGVDSIKRAQLLGELETTYQLQSLRDQNLRLSDFPTLASIHAYVLNHLQGDQDASDRSNAGVLEAGFDSEKKKHVPLGTHADSGVSEYGQAPSKGTHRFVMRMRSARRIDGMPAEPDFQGPGLVVGSNPIAKAIIARFKESGFPVHQIKTKRPIEDIDAVLDEIWDDGISRHLFITTPHDKDASWQTTESADWEDRCDQALTVPYRICQRWMQTAIDDDAMEQSTLVSVVNGNGNFGFDGSTSSNRGSSESGGIAGLTKAMLIESWMRGFRDTPMLVIDAIDGRSADDVIDGVWRELAVPSYEEEVALAGEDRMATCARYSPIGDDAEKNPITKGGTWVVAGGGRGITAMTAMELAKRHGLKLHMLGMAKAQVIDPQTRAAAKEDRSALRRQTMARIQSQGENPVKHWRNYEKAIEIDQTLGECDRLGISAKYHSVDVSDSSEVARVIDQIREADGPIHGVIQGAGSGQDARFDRKRPEKVQQCLQAKIHGCAALASATVDDPLEFFIGFGSISGRFGANGHTDYSAANDMLAKMIGRLSVQRPGTKCFTFHWHAWGDVGMATKPEAKLALEMIGMEFMPAHEGLQHFLNEIECGGAEPEVLITDRRYVRKFFPDDSMDSSNRLGRIQRPMLDPSENGLDHLPADTSAFKVTMDPTTDLFLKEHLVGGRPTLPFVMAIEMLAEAASTASLLSGGPGDVIACRNVRAIRPLKCLTDDAFAIEIVRESGSWQLVSDLRRRDGRLVEAARQHFTADIEVGLRKPNAGFLKLGDEPSGVVRHPIEYLGCEAPVYHGPSLQCLREIGFRDGNAPMAVGTIVAPSPAHLAGETRPLAGWVFSPATMDAVLYAAGMLAYRVGGRPSLPIAFEEIQFGRLPAPGEPLEVRVTWEGDQENGGEMTATLAGLNQDLVLRLAGYRVGWLG